jgi:hypothetical protein
MAVGDDSLDVEGPKEIVEAAIAAFRERAAATGTARTKRQAPESPKSHKEKPEGDGGANSNPRLGKMFKLDGKIVSLTATPNGSNRDGDAFLLILLGQKALRNKESASVTEVKQGLQRSGFTVDRVDLITAKVGNEMFMKSGSRRAQTFRLTNVGETQAEKLAEEIVSKLS